MKIQIMDRAKKKLSDGEGEMGDDLLRLAKFIESEGCFTCGNYSPTSDDFYMSREGGRDIPEYWCECKLRQNDVPVRINCTNWSLVRMIA